MPGALEVHLNRAGPHTIEVASPTFETANAFDIVLQNHGSALHVYLQLDDDLSSVASLGSANHYVEADHVRRVRVGVADRDNRVEGRLKIVTGYGSESRYVTVTIREPRPERTGVRVDEELAKPQPRESEPIVDPDTLPIVALGAIALLVAVLAGLVVGGSAAILGLAIVFVGIAVAGALLLR